jgi:phosphoglycerate dehydrogenase-like enzyme
VTTHVVITWPRVLPEHLKAEIQSVGPDIDVVTSYYDEKHEPSAEFRDAIAPADVLVSFHVPTNVRELAPRLQWVQMIGAGVDHLDGAALEGIRVTNAAGAAAGPIAEFVIGRLLYVWKRFDDIAELQREHEWRPTHGRQLAGCTLGVIGLGAIGGAVAERARALGMYVIGTRRRYTPGDTSPVTDELFGADALHEVLARCDAVVASAPSTPETDDLFDTAAFAAMKPGAVFCNVARGALVNEKALIDALQSGQLGTAILDVTRVEPLPPDDPLWDAPNILISPHSSVAGEYLDALIALFAENLARFLRGDRLRNEVDLAAGY